MSSENPKQPITNRNTILKLPLAINMKIKTPTTCINMHMYSVYINIYVCIVYLILIIRDDFLLINTLYAK